MLVDGFVIGVDLPPVIELVEAQGVLVQVLVGDGCDGVRKVEAQGQGEATGEGARVAEVGVGGQVRRDDAGAHALAQLVGVGDGQPSQEERQGAFGELVAVHGLILRG